MAWTNFAIGKRLIGLKKSLVAAGAAVVLAGALVAGIKAGHVSVSDLVPKPLPPPPPVTGSEAASMQELLQQVRQSTVAVAGVGLLTGGQSYDNISVNGFLISPSYAVVDHSCNVGVDVTVTFSNGQSVSGQVMKSSGIDNIALVKLDSLVTDVPFLHFAKANPAPGALLMEVGSAQNVTAGIPPGDTGPYGESIDNFDHAWVGRVLGYAKQSVTGGPPTPANTQLIMFATLKATGQGLGDVIVNQQGEVVGVVTWQEIPWYEIADSVLQPPPFKVAQAMNVRPAAGPFNMEENIAAWTNDPGL